MQVGVEEENVRESFVSCQATRGGCQEEWFDNALPEHQQCFAEDFWIDRYEVTNEQFDRLAGIAEIPSAPQIDHPRVNITWQEAQAFCEQRGGRLPTEVEWEYAAAGPSEAVYPWGDTFDATNVNSCDRNCGRNHANPLFDDGFGTTAPVGSYADNVTWVGAFDMSGNVWEWQSSVSLPYPYNATQAEGIDDIEIVRALRGGSWDNVESQLTSTYRGSAPGTAQIGVIGFRCVMDDS